MNYYLARFSVDNYISGKAVSSAHASPVCLPTSYFATGLTSPGVVKTLLSTSHLLGTLTEDKLVELSILRPIPGLLFLAKKVVMEGNHKASSSWP